MIQLASKASPSPAIGMEASSASSTEGEVDAIERLLLSEPLQNSRVLVVGEHGLTLLATLIRRGCPASTCLRLSARPEAAAYDLAFFPDLRPDTVLERVIQNARRAIVPGGRLVACVNSDPTGRTARGFTRRLKLNGFTSIRVRVLPRVTEVRASLSVIAQACQSINPSHRRVA